MGTNVFANNFEICSKAASGMTAGAMPDPCFTPPPTPAGVEPVIPYPNTAKASDLDKGSSKVKICNKEVALEDNSYMSTSMGDEAAKASTMQGGVMTKTTKGKALYVKWSSDVKFEGKGVCRHMDPTTHNHGSKPGHCVPTPYMDGMDMPSQCGTEQKNIEAECKGKSESTQDDATQNVQGNGACAGLMLKPTSKNAPAIPGVMGGTSTDKKYIYVAKNGISQVSKAAGAMAQTAQNNACLKSLRCKVHKFDEIEKGSAGSKEHPLRCCPGQTGHHIIPKATEMPKCWPAYEQGPAICVEGRTPYHGTHGMIHRNLDRVLRNIKTVECKDVMRTFARSVKATFRDCRVTCIEAQLKESNGNECSNCTNGTQVAPSSGYPGKSIAKGFEKA